MFGRFLEDVLVTYWFMVDLSLGMMRNSGFLGFCVWV